MRAAIGFALLAVLVIAGAWWLAGLPGTVTATVAETTLQTSTPVALLLLAVLFGLLYALLRLLGGLVRSPRRVRGWRERRRRKEGDAAVTRALLALAAGDSGVARREAERGRTLLGSTPLTLLLAAQAGRQAGREGEAEVAYKELAGREDAAFLGLRGLLRQATARGDWTEAAALARRAEAAYPGAAWLREERLHLALHTEQWTDALRLAPPGAAAALGTAAATHAADPDEARRLAKRAWEADPALAPAALAYAGRLRAAGKEKAVHQTLRRSWAASPHPDLAEFYLAPIHDPLARVQAAAGLIRDAPNHPESHLLLARLSLDAGLPGEARRHAEAARRAGLVQRRVWTLLADISEAEGDAAGARDALRHAADADPDPRWRCEACGTPQAEWHPVCPACGTAGRIAWVAARSGQRQLARLTESKDIEGLAG